ncbi:MAG: pilus assembly PilX N-terminal domain-containing protein [Clostridium sp.]|uniref:pilus assembly PilX N-terminal domain-containing protein n=1 Tax=Clostridium sp. TaxID=1506 RepID=UPI00304D998D
MRKKRGSTILMVLMIATVMIIVSSVIANSLVFTAKGTSIEKNKADFLYAAEGGLESGIQVYKAGRITDFPFDIAYLEDSTSGIKKVTVELHKDVLTNKEKIVSTVYDMNDDILVQIKLPINEGSSRINVLENTLFSSSGIEIGDTGSINLEICNIAYNDTSNCDLPTSVGFKPPKNTTPVNNPVKPTFKSELVISRTGELRVKSLTDLYNLPEVAMMNENPTPAIGNLPNGIGKFVLPNISGIPGDPYGAIGYKVILVDAPKLVIDIPFGGVTPDIGYIVVCSGEIEITSIPLNSTYGLSATTLYGDGLIIDEAASVHMTGSPLNATGSSLLNLQQWQVDFLDGLIKKYIPNFSISGSGGSGNTIDYGNIEYDIR